MIRILRHTLCLALLLTLAACEKDREPRIEVSTGEIHLPGDASSEPGCWGWDLHPIP